MNKGEPNLDEYRHQLSRWAEAMAVGRCGDVDHLGESFTAEHVKLFTDGNFDKRFEKLRAQADLLDEVFEDLGALVETYIRSVPLQAYDARTMDCDRFLAWIEDRQGPTAEQRDYLACLKAQHAVEAAARVNRAGYLRFQELRSLNGTSVAALETNRMLSIHLNPTRVWARFHTRALLDDEADLPADVLLYADRGDIRTALLEAESRDLVRVLEQIGPSTLEEWAAAECDEAAVRELAVDLAELGVIALA